MLDMHYLLISTLFKITENGKRNQICEEKNFF